MKTLNGDFYFDTLVGGSDLRVFYSVTGRHHAATLEQPEEHPELDIYRVLYAETNIPAGWALISHSERLYDEAWMDYDYRVEDLLCRAADYKREERDESY